MFIYPVTTTIIPSHPMEIVLSKYPRDLGFFAPLSYFRITWCVKLTLSASRRVFIDLRADGLTTTVIA